MWLKRVRFVRAKVTKIRLKFWNSVFSFNKTKSKLNMRNSELHRILFPYYIGIRLPESLNFFKSLKLICDVINFHLDVTFYNFLILSYYFSYFYFRDSHPLCRFGCPTSFKESYSILHHKIQFMTILLHVLVPCF